MAARPKLELADIFRKYRPDLGPLFPAAAKVVRNIIDCRTAKLGGHVRRCDHEDCGHEEHAYNSCRNRHCPKCQFLARAEWVEARVEELLPVEYFHVVFTLPHEFNAVILQNKKLLYGLLFDTSAETLKQVTTRRLGAEPGFFAVLHTWDQKLGPHPHVHMVVAGGGLKQDEVGSDVWVPCKPGYLLPIAILTKVFRGKFLSKLAELHSQLTFEGQLEKLRDKRRFQKIIQATTQKKWIVYAKPPFAGPKQVINYLGNYTHRIAISNYRLTKIENDQIHFRYRDSAHGNRHKTMSLPAHEFMRRFLLHVLPARFVRLRHYGFLGNRSRKTKVARLKKILLPEASPPIGAGPASAATSEKPSLKDRIKKLTGVDITLCSKCGCGQMIETRAIESFYDRRRREFKRRAWDTS